MVLTTNGEVQNQTNRYCTVLEKFFNLVGIFTQMNRPVGYVLLTMKACDLIQKEENDTIHDVDK